MSSSARVASAASRRRRSRSRKAAWPWPRRKALEVTAGGVGGAIADNATLQQSWAQTVVAQESVTLDQAAAGLVASRTIRARDSAIGLVLARGFHGDGVRVLMAPRAALAFGAGLGFALALVAGLRRQHRAWRRGELVGA